MAKRHHLMTIEESLIGRGDGPVDLNAAARDILARGEFRAEDGVMSVRYQGDKAIVAGKLTQDGWEVRCESVSISCSVPPSVFELAVVMRIERNQAARLGTVLAGGAD